MMWSLSSISFTQPWAWYGLAALAIPVIIHLLSKSRGRLVQWGTTRFLPQSKPVKMTQVKLTQRLLLLFRCLIIFLSLAILAQLSISNENRNNETIVLVSKTWLDNADDAALKQANYYAQLPDHQVRSLDSLKIIEKLESHSKSFINETDEINESDNKIKPLNIWHQLSLASTQFNQAKQFLVFSQANTLQFVGEKPLITQPIQWFITRDNNETNLNSLVKTPFSVILYVDDGHQDALNYLLPALNAIKQFNVNQLIIEVVDQQKNLNQAKRPDWLFYLTNKPVTQTLVKWKAEGTQLFIDGDNTQSAITTKQSIVQNGYGLLSPVQIYQSMPLLMSNEDDVQRVLWLSENKKPILTVNDSFNNRVNKSGKIYLFASLFSPKYTDLVIQPQFPLVLQTLLFNELIIRQQQISDQLSPENINQLTALLYKQALVYQKFTDEPSMQASEQITIEAYDNDRQQTLLWLGLVLVILFIVERMISEYSIRGSLVVSKNDE